MKKVRHIVAASMIGMSLIATAPVMAKQHGGEGHSEQHGERHKGKRMERMLDAVAATEQQKQDIQQIHSDRKAGMKDLLEQMKALRDDQKTLDPRAENYDELSGSIAARKGQLIEAMSLWTSETKKQVALVLTQEQVAKLQDLRDERGERRGKKHMKRD